MVASYCWSTLRVPEAAVPRRGARGVLLTIERVALTSSDSFSEHNIASLSPGVLQEALDSNNTGMIVAYHPPIFRPLKSLTLTNPLQNSLLQCAAAGISVYSPHTALDCVRGGINDWLAYGVLGYSVTEVKSCLRQSSPAINVLGETKGEGAGLGRVVKVDDTNLSIGALAARMKSFLNLKYGSLAQDSQKSILMIHVKCRSPGCPGIGSLL